MTLHDEKTGRFWICVNDQECRRRALQMGLKDYQITPDQIGTATIRETTDQMRIDRRAKA